MRRDKNMAIFEHKIKCKLTMARCQWPVWGCGAPLTLQIRNLQHLGGQLGPLAVPHPQGGYDLAHHEVSAGNVTAGTGMGKREGGEPPQGSWVPCRTWSSQWPRHWTWPPVRGSRRRRGTQSGTISEKSLGSCFHWHSGNTIRILITLYFSHLIFIPE